MDYAKFNDRQALEIISRYAKPENVRVLYVSSYIPNYVRTETLLNIFKRNKIKVVVIRGGARALRYFSAFFRTIIRLKDCDMLFLAFRAQEMLPFFRIITRKPIIFDAFVSLYDTLCFDRKVCAPDSILGRVLKWYDAYLCSLADTVLVDTQTHSEYFKKEFKAKNISYLYVECNTDLFKPLPAPRNTSKFVVFWYGKCWPLQGVDIILKAAALLKEESGIIFRLVGPVRKKYAHLVEEVHAHNIEYLDYVAYENLPQEIAKASVCLGGHFSGIEKAKRVIAGKTFQFIACGKPTIVGDNAANRELFSQTQGLYFTQMNSSASLAKTILSLKQEMGA